MLRFWEKKDHKGKMGMGRKETEQEEEGERIKGIWERRKRRMRREDLGALNRKRAEYCFESTASEQRTH